MMRLNKKRRLLKYMIMTFLLCFVYFTFFANDDIKTYSERIKTFKTMMDDTLVDTKLYKDDYLKYLQVKKTYDHEKHKIIEKDKREISSINGNFLILEYTKIAGGAKYCQYYQNGNAQPSEQVFIKECPHTNCMFTCDKNQYEHAHVVLFHEGDLKGDIKKNPDVLADIEKQRLKKQIWLLWNDEANRVDSNLDRYKFNWTMSYRYDAEVTDCSYGCKYKQTSENRKIDALILLYFNMRKNKALWFVSNCNSEYRISIGLMLQKYFPVEIFGLCEYKFKLKKQLALISNTFVGNHLITALNGLFGWLSGSNKKCTSNSECEANQLLDNKFYLSFESKNCTNYITEKFWRILRAGLIPIVFQPNKEFYEAIGPPNSFIHAQDFNYDMEKLANYLNLVSDDFKYYNKHMAWRFEYDVVFSGKQCEARRLCELCTRLNFEKSNIHYESVSNFFNENCVIN
jgi:hypothetical protein